MKSRFFVPALLSVAFFGAPLLRSFAQTVTPAPAAPDQAAAALEPALSANDTAGIRAKVGVTATVRGEVGRVGVGPSGVIHFINFVGTNRDGFVAIVRKEALAAFHEGFGSEFPFSLSGKVIEVTGTVDLYQDDQQIVLVTPDQLRVVE